MLKSLGVKKGDRVTIYLPMIPELAIAMLACARIGAPHSIVFGGFSSDSLRDRIKDCKAKVLITSDGGYRRGKVVPLKKNADEALKGTPSIKKVVVVNRVNEKVRMKRGRDVWWHKVMEEAEPYFAPEKNGFRRFTFHPVYKWYYRETKRYYAYNRWISCWCICYYKTCI